MKDQIFISHATPEDNEFTIWLASRLEMLGYKVWIDKNELLGGERFWPTIQKAIDATQSDFFAHISGIGPEKSASFINWFHFGKNHEMVRRLLNEVNVSQADTTPLGKKCEGLTFVITGDVHHYKNRSALKAYIESQGGRVAGSVSGSTNFLINNDITSTSGKNKKAKGLGIEIISEDTFIERYVNSDKATEGSLF